MTIFLNTILLSSLSTINFKKLLHFSMKIVKEHNEMATALEEKKKSLVDQLDKV